VEALFQYHAASNRIAAISSGEILSPAQRLLHRTQRPPKRLAIV
jgi:hypothetical protein